jgi:hypothetical protein
MARHAPSKSRLVEALRADIEAGGAKDALPLLAFTLSGSTASTMPAVISSLALDLGRVKVDRGGGRARLQGDIGRAKGKGQHRRYSDATNTLENRVRPDAGKTPSEWIERVWSVRR